MLYREIIAFCSQIHTKHVNTLCGQNVELLDVKLVVYIVTTVFYIVKEDVLHGITFQNSSYPISLPTVIALRLRKTKQPYVTR